MFGYFGCSLDRRGGKSEQEFSPQQCVLCVCVCVLYFCILSGVIFVSGLAPKTATCLAKPSLGELFAGNCTTVLQPLVEAMVVASLLKAVLFVFELMCSLSKTSGSNYDIN